jgi:acyl transferase domain-containing protein/acyl carrier protein
MADGHAEKKSADIAIIGMACLFPDAADVRAYWRNICRGVDAVREVPPERWRTEDFFSEDRLARDRVYSRWGAFLDPVVFDPVKWHIPPASLRHIEPMQLLSLEAAWRAMVDAGYDPLRGKSGEPAAFDAGLGERAGVLFAVPGSHELGTAYCFRTMMRHYLPMVEDLPAETRERIYADLEARLPEWSEDSFPGFLGNVIAGRIAREFDFRGPNFTVDAACAASLAALFTAVEMLRSGSADLMLVGGADGTNHPFGFMSFAKTHALSPRGKSRAFDAGGDGIALGEGIAVVVLKRRSDAERDGNKIYALLKGVGSSSDGKNRSLTAPHPPGQMRAVQRAYDDAGFSPASVGLIEAHGTGTAVGDSAELTALMQVFAPHTDERQVVAVGSVKSMIGHTKTVAGLASLIKTVLALKHRVLPPTLHVEKPNTRVDLQNSPFYLNTETRPWFAEKTDAPRRAGVSSFGFGGTNFHVLLEEYPDGVETNWTPRPVEPIVFQRDNRAELLNDLRLFQQQLQTIETVELADLAAVGWVEERDPSSAKRCRLALVASSIGDLRNKLQKALSSLPNETELNDPNGVYYSEATPIRSSEICFLYPGQGSQSVNMLRDLATGCPWSHDLFRDANRLLQDELPLPLTRFVYPPPVFDDAERERQAAALRDTRIAQPALGAVELFATELLERFGIRPAFVAGHSYGEHVALHVAGCLSRADLLRLSARRGRVCAEAATACPGAMASVQADADTVETALRGLNLSVWLANRNAPDQTVIAGSSDAIDAATASLSRRGLRTRKLSVSAAFHTPLMSAASESMKEFLSDIDLSPPRLPVYGNTTGQRHADEPQAIRDLLARHFREPVWFEKQIRQLHADGARLFVEVGPGKVLTDLVSRILPLTLPSPHAGGEGATAFALDVPGREGWTQLAHLLARLTVLGLPVRLAAWFEGRGLATGSLSEFLERTRVAQTPKATDWMLSPNKATPNAESGAATVRERKTESGAATVRERKTESGAATVRERNTQPLPHGRGSESGYRTSENAIMTTNDGAELFAQFQETTRLLLEAQQAQTRVLERYLETQERLLLHCAPNGAPPIHVKPATATTPSARPPVPIPRPASRPSVAASSSILTKPSTNGTHVATKNGVSANGEGPPPTETFRRDLLDIVSARTGYPIEALDENLALEAELGIDSIKTVEIFSKLKAYHVYFRAEEQEEEELLAEFTRLKTLRDIIDSYDRRRQALVAAPPPRANGTEKTNGMVQRYAVASVPAPVEKNGEKKNGRRDSFS